jgi:hypothetical protein
MRFEVLTAVNITMLDEFFKLRNMSSCDKVKTILVRVCGGSWIVRCQGSDIF